MNLLNSTTVAAAIAYHLSGMQTCRNQDEHSEHKTALSSLVASHLPFGPQFRNVMLRPLDSDATCLVFDCSYSILNVDREVTDTRDIRVTVTPAFGGWLNVEVNKPSFPAGSRDLQRVIREFGYTLSQPVQLHPITMSYRAR